MPGPWKTSFIPYAKEPMDAFNDPEIEHIILCFGSQASKTEILINMIGYAADQDPGPMLVVYPEDDTAKFAAENRIEPMILSVPALKNKYDQRNSEKLELKFDDIFIALNGANSPSKLASKPIRYLIRDEINKFKQWTGKEANPLDLTEERTKTFPHNRKIVDASTPTLKTGNITVAYENADSQKQYLVPCPHCGKMQTFKFKQIKWPKEINNDHKLVRDLAWYECEHCAGIIEDRHKQQMLAFGKWMQVNQHAGRVRSVGYHINSIYSPFVTFGEMARKFLVSKDFPDKLMNFINSWLAEPWEDKATSMKSDVVLAHQGDYEEGTIPEDALLLTAGIDVQLDHFWGTVRAWGERLSSWLIRYQRLETWNDVEHFILDPYPTEWGEVTYIQKACIDSGYNTDEVYLFCAQNPGICVPTKGSSNPLRARQSATRIDKGKGAGLILYTLDTNQYKNQIAGALAKPAGTPGAFMVYNGCPREYADQICSEQKVSEKNKRTGATVDTWKPIGSHAQNHLLDCEVGAAAAADMLGVRFVTKPAEEEKQTEEETTSQTKREGFLSGRERLLNRRR
ncbi:MAG: Phage terminase large subunit [Caproiciproducens sp.]|jgi:phage terminase large subunit GpA-like protein|nr:Phage terminase large subunit [Caproiciproducens sp.]